MSFLRVLFLNVLFIRINFNIVCIKSLLFTYCFHFLMLFFQHSKFYYHVLNIIHNPNWPHIFDHSHGILITGPSGSDKTIILLNLIKNEPPDID